MGFFSFIRGKIPLDDNNLANSPRQGGLPPYDALGYTQWRVRNPLREFPFASQLFVNPAVPNAGIGGLVTGGIVFQPLSSNPNPGQ